MIEKKKYDKVTTAVSLGKSVTVRGYEIKRLPLGKYLEMIEMMKALPATLMQACFPGKSAMEILFELKNIDAAMLGEISVRAMAAAPAEAVKILAHCTGIDEEALLSDENVGLDGAAEMAEAVYELNQLGNFTQALVRLIGKARESAKKNGTPTDGSRG